MFWTNSLAWNKLQSVHNILYSGYALLWGPSEVSERCPHFRGKFIYNIKKVYLGYSKVFLMQRCSYFRGDLLRGVPL